MGKIVNLRNQIIKNFFFLWERYHWIIILFFLSLICDAASTIYFMLRDGPSVEIHLAIRIVSNIFGPIVGPLIGAVGKAIAGIIVAIYLKRFAVYMLVAASIISFWAAWYNVWGCDIYLPNILKWITW